MFSQIKILFKSGKKIETFSIFMLIYIRYVLKFEIL